jgi:hypothetical protein
MVIASTMHRNITFFGKLSSRQSADDVITPEDVNHMSHASIRSDGLHHCHQRPGHIRHIALCTHKHIQHGSHIVQCAMPCLLRIRDGLMSECLRKNNQQRWKKALHTLEAQAHVAQADVAGGRTAFLAEAALSKVCQQQHPPALHLLLAEGHLQRRAERMQPMVVGRETGCSQSVVLLLVRLCNTQGCMDCG